MKRTLSFTFKLQVAYGVNTTYHTLKSLPLLKKFLPSSLYGALKLKRLCFIIYIIYSILAIFLSKIIYYLLFLYLPLRAYHTDLGATFLHIFFLLSLIGALINTNVFDLNMTNYYAINNFRLDAKEYIIISFVHGLVRMALGYLFLFAIFGYLYGLNAFYIIVIILGLISLKVMAAYFKLCYEEKINGKITAFLVLVFLSMAYLLPLRGYVMPNLIPLFFYVLLIILVYPFIMKLLNYRNYHLYAKRKLAKFKNGLDTDKGLNKILSERNISEDLTITSDQKGFAYLNDLFIKRHKKLLYQASKRQCIFILVLFGFVIALCVYLKEDLGELRAMILTYLPYFVFIMYSLNRGGEFCKCLFMNCDHSLLSYAFFKKPENLLKLFKLRLLELVKVNLYPALCISVGLSLLLVLCKDMNFLDHFIIYLTLISLSIFFSIHHLTLYYLLEPYNLEGIKSAGFIVISLFTYAICVFFMFLRYSNLVFGILISLFCILYCLFAYYLVYRFGPKTFKLKR